MNENVVLFDIRVFKCLKFINYYFGLSMGIFKKCIFFNFFRICRRYNFFLMGNCVFCYYLY